MARHAAHQSEVKLTKNTPYLALMSELWGVYCEDFRQNCRVKRAPHWIPQENPIEWDTDSTQSNITSLFKMCACLGNCTVSLLIHWVVRRQISRSLEAASFRFIYRITSKSGRSIGSCAARTLVKFQSNTIIQTSRLWDFVRSTTMISNHELKNVYRQISDIKLTKFQNFNLSGLILQLSLPNPLKPRSREWRCSWSSADRRCSSYIWVINKFIAY